MELILGDLLEFMDKHYPHEVSFIELSQHGFSQEIIAESFDKDFIGNTHLYKGGISVMPSKGTGLVLTSNGFLALNQIRMKKATEILNDSIKKFDKSSEKYSKTMVKLTWAILGLTIVLSIPIIYGAINWLMKIIPK